MKSRAERLIITAPQPLRMVNQEPEQGHLIREIMRVLSEATPEERAELEQWLVDLANLTRRK
jgi:hypothetical protein